MAKNKEQLLFDFIDPREPWEIEWQNMPEYLQEDQKPYRTLYIHFTCKEDVEDFENKIGQKIYPVEKSYWHPKQQPRIASNKRYIDEEDEKEYNS